MIRDKFDIAGFSWLTSGLDLLPLQAYAAARFAESCMRALDGDPDVYECAYVQSEVAYPFCLWVRLDLGIVFSFPCHDACIISPGLNVG
jgi:hypothetical protein